MATGEKKPDQADLGAEALLRDAINALQRARRDDYPPHRRACRGMAKDSVVRALAILNRLVN